MKDTIILTKENIVNIRKQIEGAKKEICKLENYVISYKSAITGIKKSITLNKKKLAEGKIEREIINDIDLTKMKLPFSCFFTGVFKKPGKGIITSTYHGQFEYQLHDIEPRRIDGTTQIYSGFDLVALMKTMDIKRRKE